MRPMSGILLDNGLGPKPGNLGSPAGTESKQELAKAGPLTVISLDL